MLTMTKNLTFKERSAYAKNHLAKKLFSLMEEKQTNLCCNPDLTKAEDILKMADQIGEEICVLKTHIDVIEDFTPEFTEKLLELSKKHHFFIFEDRKFADIGSTVKLQYEKGIYHIASWAHITNAHIVPGPGVIEGLKQVGLPKERGLLLLAQMSSKGSLAKGEYTQTAVKLAAEHDDFVIGFICREKLTEDPRFIHFTPGVQKHAKEDNLGQQYLTPEKVIEELGSDIIIVGRGIYRAEDPLKEAKEYRQKAWEAYKRKING